MSGGVNRRQRVDEDTDLGFLGHMTRQAGDDPEGDLDDRKRGETGPERSPDETGVQKQDKEERRHNQEDQK